jgi:hypothetical protein
MLAAITLIIFLCKFIPELIDDIKKIEAAAHSHASDREKLITIVEALEKAYTAATGTNLPPLHEVIGTTQKVVDVFIEQAKKDKNLSNLVDRANKETALIIGDFTGKSLFQ